MSAAQPMNRPPNRRFSGSPQRAPVANSGAEFGAAAHIQAWANSGAEFGAAAQSEAEFNALLGMADAAQAHGHAQAQSQTAGVHSTLPPQYQVQPMDRTTHGVQSTLPPQYQVQSVTPLPLPPAPAVGAQSTASTTAASSPSASVVGVTVENDLGDHAGAAALAAGYEPVGNQVAIQPTADGLVMRRQYRSTTGGIVDVRTPLRLQGVTVEPLSNGQTSVSVTGAGGLTVSSASASGSGAGAADASSGGASSITLPGGIGSGTLTSNGLQVSVNIAELLRSARAAAASIGPNGPL